MQPLDKPRATLMNRGLVPCQLSSVLCVYVCVLGFLHVCANILLCCTVLYDLLHQNSTADVRKFWILTFQVCYESETHKNDQ